jgi:quercetin dioxygenase-like cupin family protein
MKRIVVLAVLTCFGILALIMNVGNSLATAPSGVSAAFTVRATIPSHHFDSNDFKIFQKDQEDVVMRQLTFAPGGSSGWVSHPGPQYVIVTQGTISVYEADDVTCTAQRFSAGEGFVGIPGDVHILRNEGAAPATFVVTFLDVPVGGAFRIDAPRPGNCPF